MTTSAAETQTADRLLIAWTGDIARIKAFLDAHGAFYDELATRGHGSTWKVAIHQLTPKRGGNRVTASVGDVLVFRSALIEVDRREPKRRTPPPEPPASLYDALAEIEGEDVK